MLRQAVAWIGLVGLSLSILSCNQKTVPDPTSSVANPSLPESRVAVKKIVLGDISDKAIKKIQKYQPLADYLADNLEELGIEVGEVKIASDMATMIQMLQSGEVDVYFDSLFPAMIVSEKSGAEPILRRWKKGLAEYHTMFLVRSDSDITSLEQLQGKKLGLETRYSTSGYFLPIVYLLEQGFNPVEEDGTRYGENKIGYIFTQEEENTIQWLVSNKIEAGAIDNYSFSEIPVESRKKLRILAETEPVARQVVLVRKDLEAAEKDAIKNLLLQLDKTPEGKQILANSETTAKFDEFPAADWQKIQERYQVFKNRTK